MDRVPDELWNKVRDIVQETGIKAIPMEKKCKKAKWGGLTNSCERREVKSKGEKERYKHLNAEFQRIARRDQKDFLSDQCKEIEENNRMEKTRNLFKKIKDTKGTCHASQFSSVAQPCPTLCDPVNRSTPGLPVPSPSPGVHSDSGPSSQ